MYIYINIYVFMYKYYIYIYIYIYIYSKFNNVSNILVFQTLELNYKRFTECLFQTTYVFLKHIVYKLLYSCTVH